MIILAVICVLLLVIAAAFSPYTTSLSMYELQRRVAVGDADAKRDMRRNELYPDIITLQRIVVAWLIVVQSVVFVNVYGIVLGVMLALLVSLLYARVAAWLIVQKQVQKLYDKIEERILYFVDKIRGVLKLLRGAFNISHDYQVQSRDELAHTINKAHALLRKNEKKLLTNAMLFDDRYVRDYMTPRSVIDVIDYSETLGPLVLDSLYKTGHSHFPVVKEDIDHVVGILHVQDVMTVKDNKTAKVSEVLRQRVCYIHEDQTLEHALNAFIKQKQHIFIVVNEYRETVGVITLEDVMEMLLGRKIVDEFDKHDDLRVVAARNPSKNNRPEHSVDV